MCPTLRADPAADRDPEEMRLTREVLERFDDAIRATPEQWFWYNKRWVLDPVEPDAEPLSGPSTAPNNETTDNKEKT